jgi:hypothetical protein
MTDQHLTERIRIPTSGARAVAPFTLDGRSFLAIPQLSCDATGTPPGMNGGDSDTDLLLLRREGDGYVEHQRIPAPGGEDAEFFRIGDQAFLAVASIRSGRGPYNYEIDSAIYTWDGQRFVKFQSVPAFAAKQWRYFEIDGHHFLGLAQGVSLPQHKDSNRPSVIFEWDGTQFRPFQEIPSQWAYNWHALELDGQHFLAHADNVDPSRLYRWDGTRFVEHQTLVETEGRAFADFTVDGESYLACAVLGGDSVLLRWAGGRFVQHQVLAGAGGRELAVIEQNGRLYLVRVNFLTGTRENPTTSLQSQLYQWVDGKLEVVEQFPTSGGTDVAVYPDGNDTLVAVSNSLTADVRFSTETVIYSFTA